MNLFGIMSLSGSGLSVQRQRAEVSAANMANAETTRTEDGTPYQRRQVLVEADSSFAGLLGGGGLLGSGGGLQRGVQAPGVSVAAVVNSSAPPVMRFDPSHPDADSNGYVAYPDINPITEMVDLVGASRAYSLNASALQAEKGMLSASLDLLK